MLNQSDSRQNSSYLAKRWHSIGESIFAEMTRLAIQHKAINLGQGAPDFYGPEKILDAICMQMKTCHNQYSAAAGERALREQVSDFILDYVNIKYNPKTEITITGGASEALFCALNAFLSPEDNVLIFEPAFDIYTQAIANTGAKILAVPLIPPSFDSQKTHSTGWEIDWKAFENAENQGFKCIIINTPHNPTGKVFTKEELTKIGKAAQKQNAIIISDDVYENLSFETSRPYLSIASFTEFYPITIRISSAAKTFGFTGLKVGWACAPKHLTEGLQLVHQSTVFCVNPAIQLGLAECLSDKHWLKKYLTEQKSAYKTKKDLLTKILTNFGFLISDCDGTFFLCANYQKISNEPNSLIFAKNFINTHKIATIPLASFYIDPPKDLPWVRFAFCKTEKTLYETEKLLMHKFQTT